MDEEDFYKKYKKILEGNSAYLKGFSSILSQQNLIAKVCGPVTQYQKLMTGSYLSAFEAMHKNSLLINKIAGSQSAMLKAMEPINNYNKLAQIIRGYDFNLISSNIDTISRAMNAPSIISALAGQKAMFDKFSAYVDEPSEKNITPEDIIAIIEETEIDSQVKIIEAEEDPEKRAILIQNIFNVLMFMMAVLTIAIQCYCNCEQGKQYEHLSKQLNSIEASADNLETLNKMYDCFKENNQLLKTIVEQNKKNRH